MNKLFKSKLLIIFSIIESFLQVYGFLLSKDKSITDFSFLSIFMVIIFSFIFLIFNSIIFKLLSSKYKNNANYNFSKKQFFLKSLLLIVLWIPVLLAYYPIIWSYDVHDQIPHFINIRVSAEQPIFHTLLIEFFLFIGKIIGSYKIGMLLISIFQMFFMSLVISYATEKFKIDNKKVITIFNILMIIYFGILPFNSIMVISCTKDVLFTGLLLLLLIKIYDFLDNKDFSYKKQIIFSIIVLFFLLIKNNSIYIFIPFVIAFSIYFKKYIKSVLIMCLTPMVLYFSINFMFVKIFNPWPILKVERYSIPIQNLMYTVIMHPNEDVGYNEKLFGFVSRDKFSKNLQDDYKTYIVDDIKFRFSAATDDNVDDVELLKAWVKYGFKYPIDYIDSWANLTRGAWYLFDESHTKVYTEGNEVKYMRTDFFAINNFEITDYSIKFKTLRNILNKFTSENIQYKSLIIIRFLFCPATYILLFLLLFTYLIYNKMYSELIPLSIILSLLISILIGPTIIIRYIYPFMVIVPIIILRIVYKNQKRD